MMKKDEKTKDKKDQAVEPVEPVELEENSSLKTRLEDLENQLKRALADYQNLEKRVTLERHEWIKSANRNVLLRLLPVLDILILADKHVENQGIQLSIQQFLDALKQEGVEKIQTENKEFDPYTMECVETVEGKAGNVVEEVRAGYKLYDKILRPAQVKVGKGE